MPAQNDLFAFVTNSWADYAVQCRFRFSATTGWGGGLSGRFNPAAGTRYAAIVYPENSRGASSVLRLFKFQDWESSEYTNTTAQPLQQVTLPGVGTNWHSLRLTFQENLITVFYDSNQVASVTDIEPNPILSGGIGFEMASDGNSYTMSFDDVTVSALPSVLMAANDSYIMGQGGSLTVPGPGVLSNDSAGPRTNLTAVRVGGPAHGTLTLNANGGFTYVPVSSFTGVDGFTYRVNDGLSNSSIATVAIDVAPPGTAFLDNFTRSTNGSPLSPWIIGLGEWNVTGGILQGASTIANDYSDVYVPGTWTDFTVQARIRLPSGSWAEGLSGRLNPATGARYVANVYPEGSPLGPSNLRLIKFHNWDTWSPTFTPMALVNLPGVGTTYHTLRMTFQGNTIDVYYDGALVVHMTDNGFDGIPAYTSGAAGAHMYMDTPFLSTFDDFTITPLAGNTAPVLPAQANRTIAELTTLTVTNTGTDADLNTLSYSLLASPAGAVISSSGVITWTPAENQGPSTNAFTTVVSDNGVPSLSATNSFTVVVTEVNSAPVLPAQGNRTIVELSTLFVTNRATDADLPANSLAYSLLNPPAGATIDSTGLIIWTPTAQQGPSTNLITTRVTDNGVPPLSATNSFTVFVTDTNGPPVISAQPSSRTNNAGTTATFSVAANGSALSYQWVKNGTNNLSNAGNISGANSAILTLANVSQADAGSYLVIITNAAGSVTSAAATLTIIDPPVILTQPASRTNDIGTTATFSVSASGSSPTYRWLKNGTNTLNNGGNISGATTAGLTLTAVSTSDAGTYSVVVSNAAGSVTSSQAQLTVNNTNPAPTQLFADNFNRTNNPTVLTPWVAQSGVWAVTNGTLRGGISTLRTYGSVYVTNSWTNYSVQAQFQFPAGAYGGGLAGFVNRANGARYSAWIYPEGSAGGSTVLKLIKFQSWTAWAYNGTSFAPMAQVPLPSVGTGWHTLRIDLSGTQILVYYDAVLIMTVTDTEATHYSSGGVGADMWTDATGYTMSVDNVVVTSLAAGGGFAAPPDGLPVPPVIQSVALAQGNATITWTAVAGQTYRLQFKDNLDNPKWQDAMPDILAAGPTATATNIIGGTPQRFYRVLLLR
jgi:hypothetical protein